ncbi:hypothetical protein BS50DRAFT_352254 [Corynespora cassiicola Philippines]|uniref:Uncharacterized protein n=1 Tax=Corynespora cassiicola Philippines TaxID=1448308 RepID=A0A2T2NR61_CORCC|nr:hypothetical protein BS50DRAFT_352254 [Corynespora cassiicola Philippines]
MAFMPRPFARRRMKTTNVPNLRTKFPAFTPPPLPYPLKMDSQVELLQQRGMLNDLTDNLQAISASLPPDNWDNSAARMSVQRQDNGTLMLAHLGTANQSKPGNDDEAGVPKHLETCNPVRHLLSRTWRLIRKVTSPTRMVDSIKTRIQRHCPSHAQQTGNCQYEPLDSAAGEPLL